MATHSVALRMYRPPIYGGFWTNEHVFSKLTPYSDGDSFGITTETRTIFTKVALCIDDTFCTGVGTHPDSPFTCYLKTPHDGNFEWTWDGTPGTSPEFEISNSVGDYELIVGSPCENGGKWAEELRIVLQYSDGTNWAVDLGPGTHNQNPGIGVDAMAHLVAVHVRSGDGGVIPPGSTCDIDFRLQAYGDLYSFSQAVPSFNMGSRGPDLRDNIGIGVCDITVFLNPVGEAPCFDDAEEPPQFPEDPEQYIPKPETEPLPEPEDPIIFPGGTPSCDCSEEFMWIAGVLDAFRRDHYNMMKWQGKILQAHLLALQGIEESLQVIAEKDSIHIILVEGSELMMVERYGG